MKAWYLAGIVGVAAASSQGCAAGSAAGGPEGAGGTGAGTPASSSGGLTTGSAVGGASSTSTTSSTVASTSVGASSSSTSSSSGNPGGPVSCSMSYCNVGDGGYAFAYSDGQNMPPQSPGPSTATLESTSTLCIDGTVGEVVDMDYTDDWGCGLGVNLNQAMGMNTPEGTYTMTGTGVTIQSSPVPTCTSARVIVDEGGVDYCAPYTPGVEISWATFNTECWTNAGTSLSGPPASQQIKVQFVASTMQSCTFTGFCITSISL